MAFEQNVGMNKLANVLTHRMREENKRSLVLDFGEIQPNESLLTNTFPVPISKGDYSILRHLTLGGVGETLTVTTEKKESGNGDEVHLHEVLIPEKLRSLRAGDKVLVAWVQNEAVVIGLVVNS